MEFIIHTQRPELTPEERAKRMEAIKKATAQLVLAAAKQKAQKAQN